MAHSCLLTIVVLVATLAGTSLSQSIIVPHADGQCANPLGNYTWDNKSMANFTISEGWPNANIYSNPKFPGAAAASGGSGYQVYWQFPRPDPGCSFVLMSDYSQEQYGSLGFTAPYGNVILNTDQEGCVYSSIPNGGDIYMSFCCGTGDCANYAVGNTALYKRDVTEPFDVEEAVEEEEKPRNDEATPMAEEARRSNDYRSVSFLKSITGSHLRRSIASLEASTSALTKRVGSMSARAAASVSSKASISSAAKTEETSQNFWPRDANNCKAVNISGPNPQAGKQSMVADAQHCTSAPCSFSVAGAVSVASSLTSTSQQTITNTIGGSVAIKTGVDLIAEADVTLTATYSWAQAIAISTATQVTNTTTTTVTNLVGQQLGTVAFVTFTPTYLCWTASMDCGAGVSEPLNFCNPQYDSDNKTLQGDYTVVYID